MSHPTHSTAVKVVEVGPRDGLQNESVQVPTATKIALITRLAQAGVRHIEATAFVSPKWVPQMADAAQVMQGIPRTPGLVYSALTPNLQGLEAALAAGCDEVAVFGAASESFSQRNINCSIDESLARFRPVAARARAAGIPVRGYISCVLGCPYEGPVAPEAVQHVALALLDMGCHELSLGDTIGHGTPASTRALLERLLADIPAARLAGHFHDTYGTAIANVCAELDLGLRTFDGAVAGLGGCPYARGASGNVASEDLVHLLHALGFETGIDLHALAEAGHFIAQAMGRASGAKAGLAILSAAGSAR
ncbi:MAG: 3-hydroxy-3-isohexenylglutaryl-CoA/hydroxy-methylglutaryl-CoA lyase [Paracidovorax wautersii]|uniref:hydroxymethylglutaryl-CoA lyase n=1 Tax=Paracidovorax wautersii TaxID=1177982 RepID=A0A7V8JQ79_9BURK|nr:MAG: 3-hydroxy-3-isohexenylglutaryl-CoA/hydroxy-methylglutaryl-CoA lyase [Paracidovorax wautersii]